MRWTEEEFGITSGNKKVTNMSGIFSYTRLPVEKEKLEINPLGLYITGFDFSNDASQVNNGQNNSKSGVAAAAGNQAAASAEVKQNQAS